MEETINKILKQNIELFGETPKVKLKQYKKYKNFYNSKREK